MYKTESMNESDIKKYMDALGDLDKWRSKTSYAFTLIDNVIS